MMETTNAGQGSVRTGWMTAFPRDFAASIVVFLVAMPLCLGIAIASGVPPEKGLITGIIGGIVVGVLAGSPLQVSGPAAGLAVMVFEIVRDQGASALGPILLLAGLLQLIAGGLRLGQWFRAISPAVVHGMLAGIGLLIVAGQLHVLLDQTPLPNGLQNLVAAPGAYWNLTPLDWGVTEAAFGIGALTIIAMIGWEKIRPARMKLVPGALIGVVLATVLTFVAGLDVQRIMVPESILDAIAIPGLADLSRLGQPAIILTAVALAFIASAETLLSAAAVDRMHNGPRTRYNKELFAQGVGNMLCGAAGALPMTGVIVRSSANVQAGAVTRSSTIMHGAWILAFVALLPWLLREVPTASLAGVLVVTGWRLISLKHAKHLFRNYGVLPALVWVVTFATVVSVDLLTGVLVGLGMSLLELLPHFRNLRLQIQKQEVRPSETEVELSGSATCVQLPRLSNMLEALPEGGTLRIKARKIVFLDHTCAEMISDWIQRRIHGGTRVEFDAEGAPHVQRLVRAGGH
ncbi:MAG: SulP family inorganic anion transporter [Burkholderiales bacterium]|nr:SulP family inorganic anion transporter [Burkholderiales bacterium]